jgi:integrase
MRSCRAASGERVAFTNADGRRLRRIRLHDLGHTFVTLALQAAVPVKIVSEILGHASETLTYDTYSRVIPGMAERDQQGRWARVPRPMRFNDYREPRLMLGSLIE